MKNNANKKFFGVNYYPESWNISELNKDIDKIAKMGFNCVRIGEFAWGTIEPSEGKFDFSLLRSVVELCKIKNIFVIMCTPTAAPPRWLIKKYPEIMAISSSGQRMKAGARRHTCASSEVYLNYSKKIAEELAKEFQGDENIIGWQIDNEISSMRFDGLDCCCERCVAKFQKWMKEKFNNNIEDCNQKMDNYFWSQNYSSFDEIEPPQFNFLNHPSLQLLWSRFQEENALQYILAQYKVLKRYVNVPIGHNGFLNITFDFDKLTKELDVPMFDEYAFDKERGIYEASFWFDYYRPMKDNSFWLVETSPSWNGATFANGIRPCNFNKANVWLAYLSGAQLVNYWIWRAHYGGQELMHGSVLSSDGKETHTVKEINELVFELEKMHEVFDNSEILKSDIAIHLSSDAFKMFRSQELIPEFFYYEQLKDSIYNPIRQAQYRVDLISPRSNIKDYKLLISPFLLHIDESSMVEKILKWVQKGAIWIVGPISDIRTEFGTKFTDKSKLIESFTNISCDFYLPKGQEYPVLFNDGEKGNSISQYYEALTVSNDASSVATYVEGDYICGKTAIAEQPYGKGKIVVLGFMPDQNTLLKIVSKYAKEVNIDEPIVADKSIITFIRKGKDTFLTAVETFGVVATLKTPFNGVDLITGITYNKNELITLDKFGTLLLKQI